MALRDEFKAFIMRGNVIDLAVGMVVGTAFSGIVKSLVDDVIMPPIGLILGGVDFSNLFITLKSGANAPADGYATLASQPPCQAHFQVAFLVKKRLWMMGSMARIKAT